MGQRGNEECMDENTSYFDHISTGMPTQQAPRKEKGSGYGLFFAGLIAGIGGALLIVAVAYLGFGLQGVLESRSNSQVLGTGVVNERSLSKLQALEGVIDEYYYLDMVSDEELQTGIYRGLMDALGDPYTVYYSAEELTTFMEQTEGTYYGIGAYMTQDLETTLPMITGVMSGAPAEVSGLRANDLIYEVDGVSVYGMSLEHAISLIKGPEDTEVTLTIAREDADGFLDVTLTRARVETPTVTLEMMDNDIAYIEIVEFDSVSVDQFADALATAKASGMKGMILDLRGNPGGSLDAVVDMARMILPEGMVVYTENKKGDREEYTCDGKRQLKVPLVVLVDGNSASAAEIMSGAIKDYGLGTLVGTTTFGKGIVQQIVPFKDGSAVKITTSAYYTPNGHNIHGTGIEPDVVCEFDGEAYYGSEDHPDNKLDKAIEVLLGMMGK